MHTTRAQINTLLKIAACGYSGDLFTIDKVPGLQQEQLDDLVRAGLANRTRDHSGVYYCLNYTAAPIINANK